MFKLINGDSLIELDKLEENSIDAIVTDPPYELGFMSKSWDSTGIAYSVDFWKKCLRVLKPGGHLLAFSGARTSHRMVCAIEDAGFEIRDNIMWLYGSAMPKGQNIGKLLEPDNKWKGWNSQLKPAYEPICMARKPLEGTIIENINKWGVGGINIDECRVGDEVINGGTVPKFGGGKKGVCNFTNVGSERVERESNVGRYPANVIHDGSEEVVKDMPYSKGASSQNNFSNGHIYRGQSFNESSTSLNGFREWYNDEGSASRYYYCAKASSKDREEGLISKGEGRTNVHPTWKPTELMQYLVRLISPKGSTILDPFMGSGSTGKAIAFENKERDADYSFIGIEMEKEYCEIAQARIDWANDYKEEIKSNVEVERPKDLVIQEELW